MGAELEAVATQRKHKNQEEEEEGFKWELCSSLLAFSSSGATQPEREEVSACRGVLEEEEEVLGWSQACRMA